MIFIGKFINIRIVREMLMHKDILHHLSIYMLPSPENDVVNSGVKKLEVFE